MLIAVVVVTIYDVVTNKLDLLNLLVGNNKEADIIRSCDVVAKQPHQLHLRPNILHFLNINLIYEGRDQSLLYKNLQYLCLKHDVPKDDKHLHIFVTTFLRQNLLSLE